MTMSLDRLPNDDLHVLGPGEIVKAAIYKYEHNHNAEVFAKDVLKTVLSTPICFHCTFAEPLSETLDGILYFCNFRGCTCKPNDACHAFENKNEEENNDGKRENE